MEGQSAPTEKHWWLGRLLNYGQHAVVCSQIQALCATPSPPMHSDTAAAEHQPPSMHSHIIAHVYPPMILPFEMVPPCLASVRRKKRLHLRSSVRSTRGE